MTRITQTLMAAALAAALLAVPALAQNPGGGGGGQKAGGGGGGQRAIGGGGGGGGQRAIGGGDGGGQRAINRAARSGDGGGQRAINRAARGGGDVNVRVRVPNADRAVVGDRRTVNRNVIVGGRNGGRGYGNRRGTRFVFGELPFYYYDGYYHGDCSWLRRKANATGSVYWRQRLRQCRALN